MEKKLNKYVNLILFLIFCYLTIQFVYDLNKIFWNTKYDWENTKNVKRVSNVSVSRITSNSLSFIIKEKLSLDPFLTYKLIEDRKAFFFRFSYSLNGNQSMHLKDLIWLNNKPKKLGRYNLESLKLDLKKGSGISSTFIGNGLSVINESKYLKKTIIQLKDVNFYGNNKDLLGIDYFGNRKFSFKKAYEERKFIPSTQSYIVMIEPNGGYNEEFIYFRKLLNYLKDIGAEKVFVITCPTFKETDNNIIEFNNLLINEGEVNKRIKLINTNLLSLKVKGFYRDSVNEISKKGYEKIAYEISSKL